MTSQKPYLMYVADPMCSWCWGFAPTLERLLEAFPLRLRLVIGGLRPGAAAQLLDERLRTYLKTHWKHVQEASGQSFNMAALERENWLYDTEPAARAVLGMRQLSAESEYPFFKDLQRAFYLKGQDITSEKIYEALLEPYPVEPQTFLQLIATDSIKTLTYQDFSLARQLGIQGFPSLLLGQGDDLIILSRGYQSFERLSASLQSQLEPIQFEGA